MNAQSRMAKTLGCLVGAMTLGTVLLQFIQPSNPVANDRYMTRLIAAEIKQAVRPEGSTAPARWQGILVRAHERPGHGLTHFQISSEGRLVTTDTWLGQQEAGTRLIEVVVEPADAKAFERLNGTLVALLTELRGQYLVNGGSIQVDENSFAAAIGRGRAADYLKQLKNVLRENGLTG